MSGDSRATGLQTGSANSSDPSGNYSYRYAHPGHDRIARELSELRQREDELRGRWREMGLEVPVVSSENETPFSLPEPIRVSESRDQPDGQKEQPRVVETVPEEELAVTLQKTTPAASPPLQTPTISARVHPFEDPDDDVTQRVRFTYFPADETPIQREIRLASEREETLRLARGIISKVVDSERQQVTQIDVVDSGGRLEGLSIDGYGNNLQTDNVGGGELANVETVSRTSTSSGRVSMRLLASSRLAMEIEREKQREIDLRRLGCIHTISEERSCHPTILNNVQTDSSPLASPAERPASSTGSADLQHDLDGSGSRKSSSVDGRGSAEPINGFQPDSPSDVVAAKETTSSVRIRSSSHQRLQQTTELIERELREQQQRELELRKQRASYTASDGDNSNFVGNGVTSASNDDVTNHDRRSSTLIEQWESKIASSQLDN